MLPSNDALYSIAYAFSPRQLTIARELRGLLKHELATRVGKSASAIGQFEGGRARPEPQTIVALGLALGVPPRFFAREPVGDGFAPDRCHFRSLRSSTVREQRYILARGELVKELVATLEREKGIEFPAVTLPQLSHPPSTLEQVEACADSVRAAWNLRDGPLDNVVNHLESRGVIVVPMEAECRRVDAFSTWCNHRPFVFLNSDKGISSRSRFDAAHELGHLVMHTDVLPGSREAEAQADCFAGAFLMPRSSFGREFPRRISWPHLRELKLRWKVSYAALLYRAKELSIISEFALRRAYVEMRNRGWVPEPDEPLLETPTLLQSALENLAETGEDADLPDLLGIHRKELQAVIQGASFEEAAPP